MSDDKKIQHITRNINNIHIQTSSSRTSNNNKSSETKSPAFQLIPPDELLSLFEQRKGSQYFIPEGFEPVLIPRGAPLTPVANLLQNGKNFQQQLLINHKQLKIQANQTTPDVVTINTNVHNKIIKSSSNNQSNTTITSPSSSPSSSSTSSDVRFPQLVLARSTPTPQRGSTAKAQKPKKPPRPPNAFILYRRSKQPDIVAQNEGISNNEVSKQVGEMWHKEPLEEKMKFQRLADAAKMEHMKKYPEYKYRPRRPHEKRRRTKRPSSTLNNVNNNNNVNIKSINEDDVVITTATSPSNECEGLDTSPLMNSIPSENDLSTFLQQHHHHQQPQQQIERRSSIESNATSLDDYFDESRRSSMISCGGDINEINEIDYDYSFLDDSLVNEQQYNVPSSCNASNSQDFNVCDSSFDIIMENVSPGNDSDTANQYIFGFGFQPDYATMQYNSSFDYSLMQNDQMIPCAANIDA